MSDMSDLSVVEPERSMRANGPAVDGHSRAATVGRQLQIKISLIVGPSGQVVGATAAWHIWKRGGVGWVSLPSTFVPIVEEEERVSFAFEGPEMFRSRSLESPWPLALTTRSGRRSPYRTRFPPNTQQWVARAGWANAQLPAFELSSDHPAGAGLIWSFDLFLLGARPGPIRGEKDLKVDGPLCGNLPCDPEMVVRRSGPGTGGGTDNCDRSK